MQTKAPIWFWAVAGLAVLWNVAGVAGFFMDPAIQKNAIARLPEAERALYEARPFWSLAAFAIAVFGGLAGSLALAFRRRIAAPIFALSLAAVFIQMFQTFILAGAAAKLGLGAAAFSAVIIVLGAAELWFSLAAKDKGLLV